MKNVRVAFLSLNYLPSQGGLVRYIQSYSEYLEGEGGKPLVFCTNANNKNLKEREMVNETSVIRCDISPKGILSYLWRPFSIVRQLRQQIEKNISELETCEFIVVRHLYCAFALAKYPNLYKKSVYVVPLIASRLEYLSFRSEKGVRKGYALLNFIYLWFMEKKVISRVKLAALSSSKRDEVSEFGSLPSENIIVVPPGVDMRRFQPPSPCQKEALRARFGVDNKAIVILVVARLVPEKNIELLLNAFHLVKEDCYFFIVGDGPLRERLEEIAARISDRIVFWGGQDKVEDFYQAADLFVLPSIYEGFGHVFLEALASGIPVVGLRNDPPRCITASDEIIRNDVVGCVADAASPKALADAINKQIKYFNPDHTNLRVELIKQKYSWASHHLSLVKYIGVAGE